MKKTMIILILLLTGLWGCGSGDMSTSGTLTVKPPTASNGIVTAIATYTPAEGKKALPGQIITFSWYTVGDTTKVQSSVIEKEGRLDSGSANSQFTLNPSRSESIIVYVKATTGGLTNIEGWQSVVVTP